MVAWPLRPHLSVFYTLDWKEWELLLQLVRLISRRPKTAGTKQISSDLSFLLFAPSASVSVLWQNWSSRILPLPHFVSHLVNTPWESAGLRDEGAWGEAGRSSKSSIHRTPGWRGVPPACWINHGSVHPSAAVQLTRGDAANAFRRFD